MVRFGLAVAAICLLTSALAAQEAPPPPVVGTWDLILTAPDGRFDVPGEHNITAHPVDRGIFHPARFRGLVRGSNMTLTIQLTDTTVTLGPVLLVYGKEPRMGPCPICRRP